MAQLRNINVIVRVNKEVPAQVLLSKPVVLLDARGRYAPFHLEVIDSAEVYSPPVIFSASATHVAFTGLHRRPEGPVQGRWSTQNRVRRIRTRGLET